MTYGRKLFREIEALWMVIVHNWKIRALNVRLKERFKASEAVSPTDQQDAAFNIPK
jgi:hypothetical protein